MRLLNSIELHLSDCPLARRLIATRWPRRPRPATVIRAAAFARLSDGRPTRCVSDFWGAVAVAFVGGDLAGGVAIADELSTLAERKDSTDAGCRIMRRGLLLGGGFPCGSPQLTWTWVVLLIHATTHKLTKPSSTGGSMTPTFCGSRYLSVLIGCASATWIMALG